MTIYGLVFIQIKVNSWVILAKAKKKNKQKEKKRKESRKTGNRQTVLGRWLLWVFAREYPPKIQLHLLQCWKSSYGIACVSLLVLAKRTSDRESVPRSAATAASPGTGKGCPPVYLSDKATASVSGISKKKPSATCALITQVSEWAIKEGCLETGSGAVEALSR